MSMTVADDAIIEAENQVNFNWARTLPSHRAATHTMYALALGGKFKLTMPMLSYNECDIFSPSTVIGKPSRERQDSFGCGS